MNDAVSRAEWVRALLAIMRAMRAPNKDTYYVRRGGIDWTNFTWPKDFAIAVRCAENTDGPHEAPTTTVLELTVMTRLRESIDDLDDELLDAMESDMRTAVAALAQTSTGDRRNRCLVVSYDYLGSVEITDARNQVQGWYITYNVSY